MLDHNLTSGSDTALPKLTDIHADAIVLSGLLQALGELDEIETQQARCGRASVAIMAGVLVDKITYQLGRVAA